MFLPHHTPPAALKESEYRHLLKMLAASSASSEATASSLWVSQGYLVGGAVRDVLLGRDCADFDWLVLEPKREAERLAEQLEAAIFALDEARGFYRLVAGQTVHDFTPLADMRVEALEADLRLRDFSLNAIALAKDGTLHDPTGGRQALQKRQIAMIARENLHNDPLRPLRAVRFAAQLGFSLQDETKAYIQQMVRETPALLQQPAAERVRVELEKLLLSARAAEALLLLDELGLLAIYLPELPRAKGVQQGGFHHLDVFRHSLEALHQLIQGFPEAGLELRWATLLHDIGKASTQTQGENYSHFYGHDKKGAEISQSMLKRLRASQKQQQQVSQLVRYHMLPLPKNAKEARRFVHKRGALLPDLLKLMLADREAARGKLSSQAARDNYRIAVSRVLEVLKEQEAKPLQPLLDGKAVMQLLNLSEGARIGEALRFIREAQAVGDVHTRAEAEQALLHYAEKQGW